MAGIYIHIPFCASFCRYCSFYSKRCRDTRLMARYVDALLEEIREVRLQVHGLDLQGQNRPKTRLQVPPLDPQDHNQPETRLQVPLPDPQDHNQPETRLQVPSLDPQAQNRPETRLQVLPLDRWAHPTLYIGGGTPSLLPPELLARIVAAVHQYFPPSTTQNGHGNGPICSQGGDSLKVGNKNGPICSQGGDSLKVGNKNGLICAQEDDSLKVGNKNGPICSQGGDSLKVGHGNGPICAPNGDFEEFTLEANPDDITPERLAAWRALGVNRLSLGVQSFDDALLRWMGRRHTAAQSENAVRMARDAGFGNISLDLIFGYTGLSDDRWLKTLDRALALNPEHLSCYQMSVEEGSALGEEAAAGAYAPPAQETCARQYALLRQRVAAAGLHHYEISNFARPGYESRHNSAYWRREPYLGFGPGAHSYDGGRIRRWNNPDLDAYLAAFAPTATESNRRGAAVNPRSVPASVSGSETLSDRDLWNERVMLALRTAAGLDLSTLAPEHRAAIAPAVERLLAVGLLVRIPSVPTASDAVQNKSGREVVRIPAEHFFISDSIISDLFL